MFKNLSKKIMATALVASMLIPSVPAMAADTTDVDFNVLATEVNITVPLNFAVTIDPNKAYDDGGFVYADNIVVTNDSTCPITLSVQAFADAENTFANNVLPDGLPDGLEWDNLSVKQTQEYFALGILAGDNAEWMNYDLSSALYVKTIEDSAEDIDFGEIATTDSVKFDLEASYGKAFKEAQEFTYQITWIAELYDGE